ncbi:hydrolase, NUDIX family [Desulfococcus multivorans]|nr:hydrolase, NUDIX family [Desulfococcus multivorans]
MAQFETRKSKMKIVTAAIIENNGKVLLTRRSRGQALGGRWEFPGGKLEEGESLQQCLEREIQEELSVKIKAGDIFDESVFHYEKGTIRLVAIHAELLQEDIQLSVHDKFDWVEKKLLGTYDFAPADIPIAKKLQESCSDE